MQALLEMETATKLIQLEQVTCHIPAAAALAHRWLSLNPHTNPHPQPSNASIIDACFAKLHIDMSHLAADSAKFKMLEM